MVRLIRILCDGINAQFGKWIFAFDANKCLEEIELSVTLYTRTLKLDQSSNKRTMASRVTRCQLRNLFLYNLVKNMLSVAEE